MEFFNENAAAIEKDVFFHTADLFILTVDLIFYDTTTALFSIDMEDNDPENEADNFRRFGHAKEVIVGDGERRRRYILCYNPKEAKRQQNHRAQIIEILEQELAKHPGRSASAQWAIELLAPRRFKRYLTVTKSNRIRIDRRKIREAVTYDGKWVLETNDDTISLEDAACGYKGLTVIERCFRSLKRTQIKMTPMYHWLTRRIESHVRICVLALLIQRIAELSCGKPWQQIRRDLETVPVSNFF